jgi:hypothetical protein
MHNYIKITEVLNFSIAEGHMIMQYPKFIHYQHTWNIKIAHFVDACNPVRLAFL